MTINVLQDLFADGGLPFTLVDLLLFAGIALIAIGVIKVMLHIAKKIRCSAQTTGTIIDVESFSQHEYRPRPVKGYRDIQGTETYTPMFEFFVDGQPYKVKWRGYANQNRFRIGMQDTIMYNPRNPKDCFAKSSGWASLHAYFVLGVVLLIAARLLQMIAVQL